MEAHPAELSVKEEDMQLQNDQYFMLLVQQLVVNVLECDAVGQPSVCLSVPGDAGRLTDEEG